MCFVDGLYLAHRLLKLVTSMNTKPDPNTAKTSPARPVRKSVKGATETSRLFLDVNETIRRTQALPLTRYVE